MSNSATKLQAAIVELAAAFPAAFTLDPALVRPMKLGIKDDLTQSVISHRRIKAALRSYCNSVPYLRASTEGAARIDLTGAPAGVVTATEAQHATERLAALTEASAKRTSVAGASKGAQKPKSVGARKTSPGAATAPKVRDINKPTLAAEPATSGPKRLSLADLKRAAAARKATR
jgi:ProP effector